jgi:hypothetical protein
MKMTARTLGVILAMALIGAISEGRQNTRVDSCSSNFTGHWGKASQADRSIWMRKIGS